MKCSKCGNLIENDSNICPNCHNVIGMSDIEEIEELDIKENMAPPSLDVNEENLTKGITDISISDNEKLYEVDPDSIPNNKENTNTEAKQDDIQLSIPSVQTVVENADMVTGVVAEQDKKSKKIKIKFNFKGNIPALYALVGIIVFLILGLLLGKTFFSKTIISSGLNRTEIKTKVVADGKNNETYINGYKYLIPDVYTYDKSNQGLYIFDKSGNVRMYIKSMIASYDNMAVSKGSIKETLKENRINVNSIEEKKLKDNGESYIIIEVSTDNSKNRLVAYRKIDNENVFYIEIVDTTNNYNMDALLIIDDILNNAKKEEGATLEELNIFDMSDIISKTANEYKALISN